MFLLLPVRMNYRTERLPIVTLSLIGVNVLVYLIDVICFFSTQGDSNIWVAENLWLIPAYCKPWTFLTSMFVHADFFHILGNMIFLFLFGCCVEDMVGRGKFLAFYLLGGLVAEFAYIAMSPDHFASEIPMGGASGAISACMGMYLLLRANADIEFKYFFWFLFTYMRAGEFEVPAWVAITCWFLKDLLYAIIGMFSHHAGGGVAFGAHVGGMLAGMGTIGIWKWIGHRRPAENEPVIPRLTPMIPALAPVAAASAEIPSIFLCENGVQSGPFTLSQIQAALAGGAIGHDAVYWSEGMTDWQSVTELSGGPI